MAHALKQWPGWVAVPIMYPGLASHSPSSAHVSHMGCRSTHLASAQHACRPSILKICLEEFMQAHTSHICAACMQAKHA
eukprot:1139146-Pelagomonas_calceolata.AAC.3